jgi:hypothetical protein
MHHECPCVDKLARHLSGTVANTPGTTLSPRIEAGIDLRHVVRVLLDQDLSSLPHVRALMNSSRR